LPCPPNAQRQARPLPAPENSVPPGFSTSRARHCPWRRRLQLYTTYAFPCSIRRTHPARTGKLADFPSFFTEFLTGRRLGFLRLVAHACSKIIPTHIPHD